eukprot:SAG31_NODE_1494_length_8106_cov_7.933183_8_plen_95_part_00
MFRISRGNPTKAGERVYISMGNKPNSQLLLSYGFVLAQNQYDTVPISMFLNEEDPFRDVKAKILTSKGISGHCQEWLLNLLAANILRQPLIIYY